VHQLGDDHLVVAVRRCLRVLKPAGAGAACCTNRSVQGAMCGQPLGQGCGAHAAHCNKGNGINRRHDRVAEALSAWVTRVAGVRVAPEQVVPRWTHTRADGAVEAARLDLVLTLPGADTAYVDVSLVDPATADAAVQRQRAVQDGHGIRARTQEKHRRYPGAGLVAFVMDTMGQLGPEAIGFMRDVARTLPQDERAAALCDGRQSLAAALQREGAELQLSATTGVARPWHTRPRR